MKLDRFRIPALIGTVFVGLSVFAQEKAKESSPVKQFTQQQLEDLRGLNNQIILADAQIRAAVAERALANERSLSIMKDACRDAGYPISECVAATNEQGQIVGVRRIEKQRQPEQQKDGGERKRP